MVNKNYQNLLHKELSYQIQGAAIEVRKNFGPGHKESIYQNAFAEELKSRSVNFEREKSIKICSPKTGKIVGYYKPDFAVENKIIIELKAQERIPKNIIDQLYDYLRNSKYELGYFINFSSPKLFIKRIIFTNDRKFSKLEKLLVALSFILVAFSVSPAEIEAAKFFTVPPELMVGQEAEVFLAIDTENQNINAVELKLNFSREDFSIKKINEAGSLISFWVDSPFFSNEKEEISLSGIIPGGYQGKDGELLKINLIPLKIDKIGFILEQAKVLLNDGQGTKVKLNPSILNFEVVGVGSPNEPPPISETKDMEPPESFVPEIGQHPDIFNEQWFLAFSTQDKNSGISHYELRELRYKILSPFIKWQTIQSPYLLKNQKLRSFIYVKAVDRAGNERIAVLPPTNPLKWYENYFVWVIIIVIVIIFTCIFIKRNLWKKLLPHQ